MIYKLSNVNVSGKDDLVTCSATVEIWNDEETEMFHSDSISTKKRPSSPAGWYAEAKTDLLSQAESIRDKFLTTFGAVTTETGLSGIEAIKTDIQTHIEGEL